MEIIFIIGQGLILLAIALIGLLWKKSLSAYLSEKGKNLATKEDITAITTKVEEVKQLYKFEFETKNRYSSKQFELYNELWSSLIELKIAADDLWAEAKSQKVIKFAKQVFNTKKSIEKSALLIKREQYQKLLLIIKEFEEFKFGKNELIKLRNKNLNENNIDEYDIRQTIEQNRQRRKDYLDLLKDLETQFKMQINGEVFE